MTLRNFIHVNENSDEIFVDKLRSIKFPDYSSHTCVNNAYQEFITKFLLQSDRESDKDNFKYAKLSLKNY